MLDNKIITDHSGKIPLKYRLLSNILRGASKIPNRYRKGIGHILGWLLWQLPLKMNRIAAINIQHCHQGVPQCYVDTLIKQNALLVGQAFLYTAVAWYGTRQQIVDHLTHKILGLDQIKKCQQSGKGVLLLAMHSLFLELDGRILAEYLDLCAVERQHRNRVSLLKSGRHQYLKDSADRNHPRTFIRWLQQGKTVLYLPDQDYGLNGAIKVSFFNQTVAMLKATVRIAKIGHAKVFIGDSYWTKSQKRVLSIEPFNHDIDDEDGFLHNLSKVIEKKIKEHPGEYMWQHKRFKSIMPKEFYS